MEKVKSIILSTLIRIIRLVRFFVPSNQIILATSDIPRSNMGDQALMLGAIKGIRENYTEKLVIITTGTETVPFELFTQYFSNIEIRSDLSIIFITDRCFMERLKYCIELISAKKVFYVGADILDGTYASAKAHLKLGIMNKTRKAGVPVRIVSFSLSEEIDPRCIAEFKDFKKDELYVRDPSSAERVKQFAQCEVNADCAFLMDINDFNLTIPEELQTWLKEQPKIIAISIKNTDVQRFLNNGMTLKDFSIKLTEFCVKEKCSILLLPHVKKDTEVLNSLNTLLMGTVGLYFQNQLLPAPQLKFIVKQCDLVITGRMHLAIASLGQGTPISCVPYADKFEGLCEHFGLENSVLNLETFCKDPVAELTKRIEELETDREKINLELPRIKKLALQAFKH